MSDIKKKLEEGQNRLKQLAQESQRARNLAAKLEQEILIQMGANQALQDLLPKKDKDVIPVPTKKGKNEKTDNA